MVNDFAVPEPVGVGPQDPDAGGVEGRHPHPLGHRADQIRPGARCISSAALLVKVMARISHGRASPVAMRWATRWVSTRVLPDPAPATTSNGPPRWTTARRCGLVQALQEHVGRGDAVAPAGLARSPPRRPAAPTAWWALRSLRTRVRSAGPVGLGELVDAVERTEPAEPVQRGAGHPLTPTRWCPGAST